MALFLAEQSELLSAGADLGLVPEICSPHRGLAGAFALGALPRPDVMLWSNLICDNTAKSVKTSYMTIETALKGAGLSLNDIEYTMATGYGRVLVPFADENISEISCHARGINWYFPSG